MPKKKSVKIMTGFLSSFIGNNKSEKFRKEQTKQQLKKASLKRFGKK